MKENSAQIYTTVITCNHLSFDKDQGPRLSTVRSNRSLCSVYRNVPTQSVQSLYFSLILSIRTEFLWLNKEATRRKHYKCCIAHIRPSPHTHIFRISFLP